MKMVRTTAARTSRDRSQDKSLYEHWRDGTEPPECTGAVNLALIATTPDQLAQMAEGAANRDGQRGASPTAERNDKGMDPSAITPEPSPAATPGCPVPKKAAPKPPLESQSVQVTPGGHPPASEKPHQPPDWFERIAHPAPLSQTPFGQTPQERREQGLEEIARLRAEWRRGH
jgi:hypothetical protein